MRTPVKDPDARLDYGVDWADFLATTDGDTIIAAEWVNTPTDLTLEDAALVEGHLHTAFVSGGVAGRVYRLTSRITTDAGRVNDATLALICKHT